MDNDMHTELLRLVKQISDDLRGKRSEFSNITGVLFSNPANEIFSALAKAQGEMEPAIRNRTNTFLNSDYADLNSLREAITKPLSNNNIAVSQLVMPFHTNSQLITTLGHASGQWIMSRVELYRSDNDQKFGSHLSYMRRYSLGAITNQSQFDDDAETSIAGPIDESQLKLLTTMLNKRQTDTAKFNKWLKNSIGVEKLADVPANRFDEVMTAIKSKPVKEDIKNDNS